MPVIEDIDLIRKCALGLLTESGLIGVLPTPIDELVDAAGLVVADESHLSHDFLRSLPSEVGTPVLKLVEDQELLAMLRRDTSEIHLSPAISENAKRRVFTLGHEIGHNVIPAHKLLAYGETKATLSPAARLRMEREANQFAAELAFQGDALAVAAADRPIEFDTVTALSRMFGPSIHSTMRRFVETHSSSLLGMVLKPSPVLTPEGPVYQRREAVVSSAWEEEHGPGHIWPKTLPPEVSAQIRSLSSGMFSTGDTSIKINQGKQQFEVQCHVLDTTYNILVLLEEQ